jgi:hypothetical protein
MKYALFLVFLFLLIGIGVYLRRMEGFATIPSATQSSFLPRDMPGATTTNPSRAKPESRDILNAKDVVEFFQSVADPTDPKTSDLVQEAPTLLKDLEAFLESPETTKLPPHFQELIERYRKEGLQRAQTGSAEPFQTRYYNQATVEGFASGSINLATTKQPASIQLRDLKKLVVKIEGETIKLTNLRSTDATIQTRIRQLQELGASVRSYISKVERNQMNIREVPIDLASAELFLRQPVGESVNLLLPSETVSVKQTATPQPVPSRGAPVPQGMGGMPPLPKEVLDKLQQLKWSFEIKVDYDPAVEQRDTILKRMESIEKHLSAYTYKEEPLPPEQWKAIQRELSVLTSFLQQKDVQDAKTPWNTRFPTTYNRGESEVQTTIRPPMSQGSVESEWYQGGETMNRDAELRPGFVMNDDRIRHRASTAAFSDDSVGGLDYKQRVLDLCRQVGSANIVDDTKVLGCIEQPDAVSPSYSWKGNYEMVCNRLGDGWGAWYPEMFGCPKYDPQSRYKGTMM